MADGKKVTKNFSLEDEEILRAFLFTNPHGKESFMYPQELIAGEERSPLMSAYSRTHIPIQDRVLTFLDTEKLEQARAMLPYLRPLMDIFRHPDGTLKVSRRTSNFTREWVLAHGHSSIKEETELFGYCEDISDRAGKHISGHPLSRPQVKSTRYLSYGKVLELSLQDEDLLSLPHKDEAIEHVAFMNRRYLEVTELLADRVLAHPDTREVMEFLKRPEAVEAEVAKWLERKQAADPDFNPPAEDVEKERVRIVKGLDDTGVRKELAKFVLDYSRVYLLPVTRTSVGFSDDARTLEAILTDMLSSQREEDRKRGQAIWEESKKIAPVLMGEKGHVQVDMWKVRNETDLRSYMISRFGGIPARNRGNGAVNLLTSRKINMYTDRFNAALVVFPYVDAALEDIFEQISEKDIPEILAKAHENRSVHDVLHPAISHGGLVVEMVMAYHGYRDIFRHRRGSRSTQLLSTRLGFEVPEIFTIFGIDKEYLQDMEKCTRLYEKTRGINPHVAEKLVPFGANCRALHSWQMDEMGYVGKLRSDISKGNLTYVYMVRDLMRAIEREMPITAQYLKWDTRDYPAHLWKRGYQWHDGKK